MIGDDKSIKLNLLVAYPYMLPDMVRLLSENSDVIRLVVDSGAFTAWKSGTEIKLDDYCGFIESLPVTPWRYFTLDKVGDAHGTAENYRIMLRRGFDPVPIFTRGEDLTALDRFYETSDVVGLGGLVGTQGNRGFVNGIMQRVGKRRVHWLGFTKREFLKVYRPYMADSSSWEGLAMYGTTQLYMGNGQFRAIARSSFSTRPDACLIERVKFLGLDPYELRSAEVWRGGSISPIRALAAANGVAFSLDVQKNLGTLLLCAVTRSYSAQLLLNSFRHIMGMSHGLR